MSARVRYRAVELTVEQTTVQPAETGLLLSAEKLAVLLAVASYLTGPRWCEWRDRQAPGANGRLLPLEIAVAFLPPSAMSARVAAMEIGPQGARRLLEGSALIPSPRIDRPAGCDQEPTR